MENESKTKTLEELTLKGDLFINSGGQVMKVEPIGMPVPLTVHSHDSRIHELLQKAPEKANSYTISLDSKFTYDTIDRKYYSNTYAVQYYNSSIYFDE